MAGADCVSFAHAEPFELAPKVILGTVDVAAVGARVLLSLEPPPGWSVRETTLELLGLQRPPAASCNSGGDNAMEGASEALRPVLAVTAAAAAAAAVDDGASQSRGPGAPTATSSSSSSPSHPSPPVVILRNFYAPPPLATEVKLAGATAPRVTFLIINAVVSEGAQAEVAAALLDLMEARRIAATLTSISVSAATVDAVAAGREDSGLASSSGTSDKGVSGSALGAHEELERSLGVVAAMLLQQLPQSTARLYQHTINGAAPLDPTLPPLHPPSSSTAGGGGGDGSSRVGPPIRVRDGLLAALFHVLEVSGTRACCLLTPGHKPPAATSLDRLGATAACDAMGGALAAALGLQYNAEKCHSMRALYRWFLPERSSGSDVMYL
ncbi:hypothetical protein Vretimale_14752 [Volvox reticuliferus]|uniref:Uncharacterized protein n=1 Tax=Volvox reticuliferus TaxID=1737510 RepID=A0A8J4GP16_9CHLO|nr:hypothetical protein Vretifemale_15610 [Volvox reticuliferus]GIM11200.1 hypothetical protein Vretimale_14752 [Volvox reticuliferus]